MAGANGERQSFLCSERGDNYLSSGQFLLIKFQTRKYFILSIINFCTDFVKSSFLVISCGKVSTPLLSTGLKATNTNIDHNPNQHTPPSPPTVTKR